MAKTEGSVFPFEEPEAIRTDFLETMDFENTAQYICTETKEFSAVCPFTGLPDYGILKVEYYPEGKRCVELKSLKYYLISFRNVGLHQEGVTKRFYDDLKALLQTNRLRITTIYQPRGGFETTCIEGQL